MNSIPSLLAGHALLAVLPLIAALVMALLIAHLVRATGLGGRTDRWLTGIIWVIGGLPVLAVWVLLPIVTGLPLMRALHLEAALTLLALGVLFPAARRHVHVRTDQQAARALAMNPVHRSIRTVRVWLPGLTPALARAWGLLVTAITLAAVLSDQAAQGLGQLMVRGWRDDLLSTLLLGTVLVVGLAVVGDVLIRLAGRAAGIREVR